VRLGFDVVPGGLALPGGATRTTGVNDYAVTVNPASATATMLVDGAIDPLLLDGLPPASVPEPAADGWSLERLTTNRPFVLPLTKRHAPAEYLKIGQLKRGSWDPKLAAFDDRTTWQLDGKRITLRLPWSMLGLGDPSSKTAVVPRAGQPVAVKVDDIGVVVDAGTGGTADLRIRWDAWNRAKHTERVKAGVQPLTDARVAGSRSRPGRPTPGAFGDITGIRALGLDRRHRGRVTAYAKAWLARRLLDRLRAQGIGSP